MKKLFYALLVLPFVTVLASADPVSSNYQPNVSTSTTFTTTYSTPIAQSCELSYVHCLTSGSATTGQLTIRDNTTTKFVVQLTSGAANSETIDLTRTPILFKSNLNVVAGAVNPGLRYILIYRRVD